RPPISTLFPYTTLFRSTRQGGSGPIYRTATNGPNGDGHDRQQPSRACTFQALPAAPAPENTPARHELHPPAAAAACPLQAPPPAAATENPPTPPRPAPASSGKRPSFHHPRQSHAVAHD